MQYMLLIFESEAEHAKRTPEEQEANLQKYFAFSRAAQAAGVMKAGDEIASSTQAKTVRRKHGHLTAVDGPFAETKEQLGGFFILECASMAEAVNWAGKLPAVDYGCVEVRPIIDHNSEG